MFVLVLPVGPSIYYYNNIIIYYIIRLLYFVHYRFTRTSCSKLCTPMTIENNNITLVFSSHRDSPHPNPHAPICSASNIVPLILFSVLNLTLFLFFFFFMFFLYKHLLQVYNNNNCCCYYYIKVVRSTQDDKIFANLTNISYNSRCENFFIIIFYVFKFLCFNAT